MDVREVKRLKKLVTKLRKAGYHIKISHSRRIRITPAISENGFYTRKAIAEFRAQGVPSTVEIFNKGGVTTVDLMTPGGLRFRGVAECSDDDNFCYREGVWYALKRARIAEIAPHCVACSELVVRPAHCTACDCFLCPKCGVLATPLSETAGVTLEDSGEEELFVSGLQAAQAKNLYCQYCADRLILASISTTPGN